jgi:RHS repeat-associated protein
MVVIGNNIKSGLDYTPFGMLIPNRTYNKIPSCEPVVTNQVVDIINEDYDDNDKGDWEDGEIEFSTDNYELVAEVASENNNTAIAGRVYSTVIGEEYTISFDVTDLSGLNGASLLVYHTEFDGSTFDEVTTVDPSQNPFEITSEDEYTFTVTAGTELLAFNLIVAGSSSVVGSTFTIDNFIITGPQQIRTFNCAGDNYLAINYRFGFNGMEKDNEVRGENSAYEFGGRSIYDPRRAGFMSIDPRTGEYAWQSPYAYYANSPISTIDYLGHGGIDLEDGTIIDDFEPENLGKLDAQNDHSPWQDIIDHNVSLDTWVKKPFIFIQKIDAASGSRVNLDHYSANIDKLPEGWTLNSLFNNIRLNLNLYLEGGHTHFKAFNEKNQQKWESTNPVGAIMQFDAGILPLEDKLLQDWLGDDLTVVVTDYKVAENYAYWVFSTATALFSNGNHAVSGSRQFGVIQNSDCSFTFFTRAADRTSSNVDLLLGPIVIFPGGDNLWSNVMKNVSNLINLNGGVSQVNKKLTAKKSYTKFTELR